MKLIALDVGTKRIGVAKADSKVRIAIPYNAVEVNGEEFQKIASLARAWDINNFVLGLPRNSQGQETKQSLYVRQFAKALKKAIPDAKICFQDESLTSVEAEKRLEKRKKGFKKGDVDSEAAAIILQDFLEEKTGKTTTRAASAKHKSVKGNKPHRFLGVVVGLVILLVVAGVLAVLYYQHGLNPVADKAECSTQTAKTSDNKCRTLTFPVATGSSISEIATNLKNADLIRDALVFQVYFRLNTSGDTLKAGEYELSSVMSVAEITELLLSGSRDHVFSFTVFPGETSFDIKKKLVDLGYDTDEVTAALEAGYGDAEFAWMFDGRPEDSNSIEGYLWPDTYEFYNKDTASAIITRFLSEAAKKLEDEGYQAKFAEHGLSLYQGIALASVVQREANNATDMQKVAQVFYNRLGRDMTLGSDVTAKYAADLVDPDRQTYTDNAAVVGIDSPYNTRRYAGLPYGPVSNPGEAALSAVATPDTSMENTLFFLTGDDGMMYYSDTEEGHYANRDQYCQKYCNVGL